MIYVTWAVLYEGSTDAAYFDVLIPHIMEEILLARGIRNVTVPTVPALKLRRGPIEEVAQEACKARDAFHLIFIHVDTGGRNLEIDLDRRLLSYSKAMQAACDWPPVRCITVAPRHEMEAWALADAESVTAALGYNGAPALVGLPSSAREAERLADPKAILQAAVSRIRGRRRPFDVKQILPAIAQRQSLEKLRGASSFAAFEQNLLGFPLFGVMGPHA